MRLIPRLHRLFDFRRDEAVVSIVGVKSDDLSGIVDAVGKGASAPWRINGRVLSIAVDEAVLCRNPRRNPRRATDLIVPGDLSFIIDA